MRALTRLGDHGQRQEGVGEEGRPAAEVAVVLVEQLSEGANAEPAGGKPGAVLPTMPF